MKQLLLPSIAESLDRVLLNEVLKCGELLQRSSNVRRLNSSTKAPLPLLK